MSGRVIRFASPSDAATLLEIYAPIVASTAISFEIDVPPAAEFAERIRKTLARYPWLCLEVDGQVAGYAYASEHRTRAAYQWSVDVSAYVNAAFRGQNIGKALYASLFKLLCLQGFHNVFAGIVLPNAASVALHEALGMKRFGIYESVGFKLGKWHDVGWWQGMLQRPDKVPTTLLLVKDLVDTSSFRDALQVTHFEGQF